MKDFLKKRRKELGLSQWQMADKLNLTSNTANKVILRWEKGQAFPECSKFWDLKEAYQLTDEELIQWLKYINDIKKDPKKKFLIHPLDAISYPTEFYWAIK